MSISDELLEMNLGRSQLEGSEKPPLMPSECRDLGCPESPEQKISDGSQSKSSSSSSSSSDDFDMNLSEFLEAFPNPPQLMRSTSETGHQWFICSRSEIDVGAPMNTIHDKIISAFSNMEFECWSCLAQFWAPVRIDGRLLLSNSGQPFALTHFHKDLIKYMLDSDHKCEYNIDLKNELHIEGDPMIKSSGGPATAFLNRFPCTIIPLDDDRRKLSFMLPVSFPSQSSCLGVLQLTTYYTRLHIGNYVLDVIQKIKDAGLDICNVQEQIPYKTINGLRPAKDEIERALQIVCGSHNIILAQVWIGVKDKTHVSLSSYLEDTQNVFGLRFTGYLLNEDEYETLELYNSLCDVIPRRCTEKHAVKTLQDFKSRYISTLDDDVLLSSEELNFTASSLVICLRSSDTGDIDYAFEFIWGKRSNYVILLEALLLTLKRCFPSFKFASGAELGDELDVIEVDCSEYNQTHTHGILPPYNEICNFKIFQGKTSSPIPKALEEGKQPTVVDHIAPSKKTTPEVLPPEDTEKQLDVISVESQTRGETNNIKVVQGEKLSPICKSMEEGKKPLVKCKTAEILLTRQDVEKHFDKTMKEAAKCLEVSESTLKRKLRKLGIEEWPRTKPVKRNKKDLSINQIDSNEEVNGAIQEPSKMTIKTEHAGRLFKSCLLVSQATFEAVVKEIGVKCKVDLRTYDLEYFDEDGDWISLTSDEDMSDCIKSSRKSDRILVRLRVLPSTN